MKLKLVVLAVLVAIGVGALAVTFGGLGANAATDVTVNVHLPPGGPLSGMAADVRAGLTKPFKELSPRYFYDERGS